MSLLHRRAAQLLARGESRGEGRLFLSIEPIFRFLSFCQRGVPSCWRAEERDATALTCSLRLPTPTPPRSSPAPSLTLSFQRTLGSRRAAIRHGGAFYINDKVWARGGRGPAGGGAGTKPPAGCSKRRARQGRADVSRRVAKPRRAQRSAGERVSLASPGPSGVRQGPRTPPERTRTVGRRDRSPAPPVPPPRSRYPL